MRGSLRPNRTAIYWPPLLWPSALCFSRSPEAQPEAQGPRSLLDDGFLYCIQSATSLPPQLNRPYHITSLTPTVDFQSWLSYIIVQRPLNHPLNLWNGMFDRHQAEITVMQFTGHSLPVHQSMSVPWDFFTLSHFVSQARLRDFLS